MSRGKVVVGGGSGFVGQQLCKYLTKSNYEVLTVGRSSPQQKTNFTGLPQKAQAEAPSYTWSDIKNYGLPRHTVGVVNLAGENVLNPLKRWNEDFRKSVYTSRVDTTRTLAKAICETKYDRPSAFVCMSGVGFYPPGSEIHDETSPGGNHDFLALLCTAWEEAARLPEDCGTRSVSLRSGVVLGRHGGMIQQLIIPYFLGLGGRIGSGQQPLPWIHIKDLARLIIHCLENDNCNGVLNAVAPQTITNEQFAKQFAKQLRRPAIFPVPEFVFNLLYGEERANMVTKGQVVTPTKTLKTGFTFSYPTIEAACEECAHLMYQDTDDYLQ